jgi:hypothetical protein
MFKPKEEPTFEKKVSDAVGECGQFVVDEVMNAIELTDDIKGAYMMFLEFEQHSHVTAMKIIYNGTI